MGERQYVELPFAQGLAQQDALEWQDSTASASGVLNGNFTKQGAIDKRLGMGRLSNTLVPNAPGLVPQITSGLRAMSWPRSGLAVAMAGYLYAYAPSEGGLSGIGQLPPVAVARNPLPSSSVVDTPVVALVPYGSSVLKMAMYTQSNTSSGILSAMLTISDAQTGSIVLEPIVLYTAADNTHKVFPVQLIYMPLAPLTSAVAFLIYDSPSSGTSTAYAQTFNLVTNSVNTGGALSVPNLTDTPDLALFDGYSGGAIVFTGNAGGSVFCQFYTSIFGTISLPIALASGVSGAGKCSSACNYADATSVFTWADGSNVNFTNVSNSTFLQTGATFTAATTTPQVMNCAGIARMSSGVVLISYWFLIGGTSANPQQAITCAGGYQIYTTGGTALGGGTISNSLRPTCAPFIYGGQAYQPCYLSTILAPATSEQCTLYLVSLPTRLGTSFESQNVGLPVATLAPRQVDPSGDYLLATGGTLPILTGNFSHCPHVALYPAAAPTQFSCGLRTIGADTSGAENAIAASWSVDFLFDATNQALQLYQPGELGNELRLSGAVPFVCDGSSAFEASFFMYPEGFFESDSGGGSWAGTTGAYSWACCYAYVDSSGLVDRSAPVFTGSVTLTNGGHLPQLNVPRLFSWRQKTNAGQLFAEIYRTQVNGGTFLMVDRVQMSGNALTTYVDQISDAQIATATILYTTGGILDCVNPPAAICQTTHWGRLWTVDDTGQNVWFTQAFSPGVAPGFNEALTFTFTDSGKINSLYSMDDKLILGKRSGLWVVYGQGPAVTGQGSDITIPQPITSDGGPVDWRAGVVFPGGLIYRSDTGFMLCDRSLNVSWIGKDVTDTLASFPTVLSATLVPTATQVRFICANSSGQTVTLVYDYLVNKWISHTYPQQAAGVASSVLATVNPSNSPTFATITSDGNLWLEKQPTDTTAYLDADTSNVQHFNPTVVTTAWTKIQGVQGYQRARQVQLLFEELDDCGVTMSFAVNYNSSTVQTYSWPSAVVDQLTNKIVQQHVGGAYMKQLALQVTVSDSAGTSVVTGKGARFIGLSLELEALDGRFRQVPSIGKA